MGAKLTLSYRYGHGLRFHVEPCVAEWLESVRPMCEATGGNGTRAWYSVAVIADERRATMDEIRKISTREWIRQPNLGTKTLAVIRELLALDVMASPESVMMDCETV